jgi:DNA processing protein
MPREHWLQLALTRGIGPILTRRLVEAAGSAEAACAASAATLRRIEGISSKASAIAESLREARSLVADELKEADDLGIAIVCPDDACYPPMLRQIHDPPAVLWVRGAIEARDLHAVAIVGSRRCSLYGREQAERFGSLLAGAGVTVVSGGARGIDSSAHRGALVVGNGRTLAVLGSGVDVVYPPENATLFQQIATRGAVISEYPLGTEPLAENFPRRNRIVAGMSRGVLVIEADERSGALITARQAIEDMDRPVFAVPGRVDNPLSAGPHQLLRDGAVLAAKLEDVLDNLPPLPQPIHDADPTPDAMASDDSISAHDASPDPSADPDDPDQPRLLFDAPPATTTPSRSAPAAESSGASSRGRDRDRDASIPAPRTTATSVSSRQRDRDATTRGARAAAEPSLPMEPLDRAVLDAIGDDEPTVDELVDRSGLDASDVLRRLTMLSLRGLVERRGGQRFARRRR